MKKKRNVKQSKKHQIFIQGWGTLNNETLVCVGCEHKEVIAFAKKNKIKAEAITWLEHHFSTLPEHPSTTGYTISDVSGTFLWLREYEDSWDYWETLIHEISHMLDFVFEDRKMTKETEARAYQHEYLFRQIRRKLQGLAK